MRESTVSTDATRHSGETGGEGELDLLGDEGRDTRRARKCEVGTQEGRQGETETRRHTRAPYLIVSSGWHSDASTKPADPPATMWLRNDFFFGLGLATAADMVLKKERRKQGWRRCEQNAREQGRRANEKRHGEGRGGVSGVAAGAAIVRSSSS